MPRDSASEPRYCIDRIMPHELLRRREERDRVRARALILFRKIWINGSTLGVRFMGGSAAQRRIVTDNAVEWTRHANLSFDFTDDPAAEIRVSFVPGAGSWSALGTDARFVPQHQPTMNLGWQDRAVVLHEFGHAIGLGHEHKSPAGGIEWNEDAVIRDLSGPPNNWTVEEIRLNVLDKYRSDQIRATSFDPASIMLYFFPDSWVANGPGTNENTELSATDRGFIASSAAYPGHGAADAVALEVGAAPLAASIGRPGEEDLFAFQARSDARYRIETGGETDLMMKLYGPDSRTDLIEENDDSGRGLNPRIVRDLTAGRYVVQVRHFNLRNGTGAYSISVSR